MMTENKKNGEQGAGTRDRKGNVGGRPERGRPERRQHSGPPRGGHNREHAEGRGGGYASGRGDQPHRGREGHVGFSGEDDQGGQFGERRRESREPGAEGAARALVSLDQDIMKLLVRRAILISRVREGKDHAASPTAIKAEKSVRSAWEKNSLRFSKDPRFARNLFDLLQDLKVLSKDEAESQSSFLLNPVRKPVNIRLTGPADTRTSSMWLALCAALDQPSELFPVPLADVLTDCIKSLNQAGADAVWEEPGRVAVKTTGKKSFASSLGGKSIFVGESPLSLYLMAFLGAESTGACRFTGGATLKMAELGGLRHTLPLLGARLAHVVPRSQGLPASVEYSGVIQEHIVVPEDLPLEGVCALLVAPLVWGRAVTIDLGELPGHVAATALAEAFTIYDLAGADVGTRGSVLHFSEEWPQLAKAPTVPLDAEAAAYILALPAFCGGTVRLTGPWPQYPMANDVAALLAFAGVQLTIDAEGVTANVPYGLFSGAPAPETMAESLHPLYWAFLGILWEQNKENCSLPALPQGANLSLAGDFLEAMRLAWDSPEAGSALNKIDSQIDGPTIWTGPDAFWSMSYALAAFVRPGLRLANPGIVSKVLPYFWGLYNHLPEPEDLARIEREKKEEPADDKPSRRRIIADG